MTRSSARRSALAPVFGVAESVGSLAIGRVVVLVPVVGLLLGLRIGSSCGPPF